MLSRIKDTKAKKMMIPNHINEVLAKSRCLYTRDQIDAALDKIAKEISQDLSEKNPIFLCVVVGGMIPLGHLLLKLDFPLEVDYIHATRYGDKLHGTDLVWQAEPSIDLKDRTVVVVDDILDGGITMKGVVDYCRELSAKEVYSAVLVDKVDARLPEGIVRADYTALPVDNYYVFGFGMDYKGYLRNAPGIYAVADEHAR